jgi:myb proto-oncogene protein
MVRRIRAQLPRTFWVVRMCAQCRNRWLDDALDCTFNQVNGRTGTWTEDEHSKPKTATEAHSGKDWVAIAALVPSRTQKQCQNRWHEVLDPKVDRIARLPGKWTVDEDDNLKNAVDTYGRKDWVAVASMVPVRTKEQCSERWKKNMDPNRKVWRKQQRALQKSSAWEKDPELNRLGYDDFIVSDASTPAATLSLIAVVVLK